MLDVQNQWHVKWMNTNYYITEERDSLNPGLSTWRQILMLIATYDKQDLRNFYTFIPIGNTIYFSLQSYKIDKLIWIEQIFLFVSVTIETGKTSK